MSERQHTSFERPSVASVIVDPDKHPMSCELLSRLAQWQLDFDAIYAIRHHPGLLTSEIAGRVMTAAGSVVLGRVISRLSVEGKNPGRSSFGLFVHEPRGHAPHLVQAMIVLYKDPSKRNDGWVVILGNVWDIIGWEDFRAPGDPFRCYPPDFDELERILQGHVNKVIASIPMELIVGAVSE